MALPTSLPWELASDRWASDLNPLLAVLLTQGQLIMGIKLKAGNNTFSTKLGRKTVGWFIVDKTSEATFYRAAPLNDKTLTLHSTAPTTVSLWVF